MKIVIADDSDMVRERIKESLKNISTVEIVGEATNGKEAVKIIHEVSPDFVLLDIRMPELNGIEVLKFAFSPISHFFHIRLNVQKKALITSLTKTKTSR